MKHAQTGISRVGVINPDGHAIGLDLGANAVRAAILAPGMNDGRPSVTVHGLGHQELPEGAVVNGSVVDQGAVTRALKQLWQSHKFECRHVILGVSNPQVVVRDMQMPNLTPDQRARALPYQAREVVAIPLDQALLDFSALGEPDEADMVNGLMIAAPRQPILAAVEAVEKAGLKVARVDLSTFAALRSIAHEQLAVEAVIDLGAHLTNIVIHSQGIPKVVRTVPRGGKELTDRLADRMSLSLQDAEVAKREVGLNGSHAEISQTLMEGLRPLLAEIRSSIHYFSSTNGGAQLERISLTGGGAALKGLPQVIADQLGTPAGLITPMQHIRNRFASKQSPQDESEGWASAVSIGLAMGAAA